MKGVRLGRLTEEWKSDDTKLNERVGLDGRVLLLLLWLLDGVQCDEEME